MFSWLNDTAIRLLHDNASWSELIGSFLGLSVVGLAAWRADRRAQLAAAAGMVLVG